MLVTHTRPREAAFVASETSAPPGSRTAICRAVPRPAVTLTVNDCPDAAARSAADGAADAATTVVATPRDVVMAAATAIRAEFIVTVPILE